MVFPSNYLSYPKLYFKNNFKYMGTNISIIILVYISTQQNMQFLFKKNLKQVKD